MAKASAATSGAETIMDPCGSFFFGSKRISSKRKEEKRKFFVKIWRRTNEVKCHRSRLSCSQIPWPKHGDGKGCCLSVQALSGLFMGNTFRPITRTMLVLLWLPAAPWMLLPKGVSRRRINLHCIEKETDLILELLRLRARPNDYLIEESSKIRMCALCLMGHSDIAAGAMLGIAKETSRMCAWMSKNLKLLDDLCLYESDCIVEGEKIRHRTLEYMTSVLIMPYNPAAAVLKPSMEATNTRGDDASDTLNCQDQEKIIDADNIKKSKGIEETKREIIECSFCSQESERAEAEAGATTSGSVTTMTYLYNQLICSMEALDLASVVHAPYLGSGDTSDCEKTSPLMWPVKCPEVHLEKILGFNRLLPFNGSVEWSGYIDYLCEYYKRLAPKFLCKVPGMYPADGAWNFLPAADICLKMEEYLLSEWRRIRFSAAPDYYMVPVSTITESSLIRDRAHSSFCTAGEELSVAFTIALVCIALEADLMCELLRHGAKHTDDIIQQSSVIRLCALSLLNLKGDQSALAAIMVVLQRSPK